MLLIRRYIAREILTTFIATLFVLLAILLVQRLAIYLSQAASGLLSQSSILALLGLQLLRFTAELLPLSFLLASILAFGRLYRDSEMSAMYALGVPLSTIYKTLFQLAFPISILLILLNFWIVPATSKLQYELQLKARDDAQLTIFKAGVFRELAKGQHVVYVESIDNNGQLLRNVFVKSIGSKNEISITTAESGSQFIDPETNTRFLTLNNGSQFREEHENSLLHFKTIHLRLDTTSAPQIPKAESLTTKQLLAMDYPYTKSELHRRISAPISIFILTLLIPALTHSKPREGRFNRLLYGVIIYVVYFNLLGIGQAWLRKNIIPSFIGLWWVHITMLACALFLWHRRRKNL